ncbi:MAG: hypothetical protein MUQ56_04990 [Thermoleophilia bacterium]|nr:hypothetical protein [Thermoleophilia bacterium]
MGWFHQIKLCRTPIFATGERLEFGKVTVMYGANGTGKTALWEWAAGIGDATRLKRWVEHLPTRDSFRVIVTYFDPLERNVGVTIEDGQASYTIEGKPVPLQPHTVRFIAPKDIASIRTWEGTDDLRMLSAVFGIPVSGIANLVQTWCPDDSALSAVELSQGEHGAQIAVRLAGRRSRLPLGTLSFGELGIVLIEIAMALAAFLSEYSPTVLILDELATFVDDIRLQSTIERLCTDAMRFQTIVALPDEGARTVRHETLSSAGASPIWLEGEPPMVKIRGTPPT